MDAQILLQVGGIFVALEALKILGTVVLKLVGNGKKGGNSGNNPGHGIDSETFEKVRIQVAQLHEWHNTEDPDTGMKRWIMPPKLLETIEDLTTEIHDGHDRLRKGIDLQTAAVVENTAEVKIMSAKISKFIKM